MLYQNTAEQTVATDEISRRRNNGIGGRRGGGASGHAPNVGHFIFIILCG